MCSGRHSDIWFDFFEVMPGIARYLTTVTVVGLWFYVLCLLAPMFSHLTQVLDLRRFLALVSCVTHYYSLSHFKSL
jgi:hypothetical protein